MRISTHAKNQIDADVLEAETNEASFQEICDDTANHTTGAAYQSAFNQVWYEMGKRHGLLRTAQIVAFDFIDD